jgi:hypothetical protein
MFSNNPLYVEKLVQTKQADILRELPDHRVDGFQETGKISLRLKVNSRIWAPVALFMALAWLFRGVF